MSEDVRSWLIPRNHMGTPDDLAKAAVFPASDDSSSITGVELFVEGGSPSTDGSEQPTVPAAARPKKGNTNNV
jgi:NAD(P)-dependent dehydrogenase (short-subunit alcohol dehydrogenase family)